MYFQDSEGNTYLLLPLTSMRVNTEWEKIHGNRLEVISYFNSSLYLKWLQYSSQEQSKYKKQNLKHRP